MSTTLIYAFVFAAVLLLVDAIGRLLGGMRRARREVNARLARLGAAADQGAAYRQLLQDRGVAEGLAEASALAWVGELYRQSGLQLPMNRRLLYLAAIILGVAVLARLFTSELWLQVVLGLIGGPLVAIALLMRLRSRRIKKFVEQLPIAIDIVVRSLNAGHPLLTAISLVGREMPDPIGSEFGLLSDQLTFGLELDRAMLNMVDRVGADELNLLAVTVSVQRGTGGNLSEVLENLSAMIRDRTMLKAKIRAISAEGRMTGRVMTAFPFILYLMISTLAPQYFDPLWETGWGPTVVTGGLIFLGIGILVLNRMVRFDF